MEKRKRKLGDRRDGYWLRDLPAMHLIMPSLMPNRADNEAFVSTEIDLRPIEAYLAKKNEGRTEDKYTIFHLISCAIGKAFVLRPKMNRFVVRGKLFQRNEITVAFIVKKKFEDKSEEGMAYLVFDENETLDSFHAKIMKTIHGARRADVKDKTSGVMDLVCKLPHGLVTGVVKFVRWLDGFGMAPAALIDGNPHHSAIFLSNLGSIGLESGYHHLVNWGTNSFFAVLGKKRMVKTYDKEGNEDLFEALPIGITLDERIADGYYYSGTMALVKELLAHPELLELPASTPVEYAIKR